MPRSRRPVDDRAWFTTGELAEWTGQTIHQIETDFDGGVLRGRRSRGRHRFISRESAAAYLQAHKKEVPGVWPAEKKREILVVEDDRAIRHILVHGLAGKFRTRALVTGTPGIREAIAACRDVLPDLIVLDYVFKAGRPQAAELIAYLEEARGGDRVKVVILTGYPDKARADAAARERAAVILPKPFVLEELVETIFPLLWRDRRGAERRDPLYEIIP